MIKSKEKIYKHFTVLPLLFGIVFSVLILLYQVPDEEAHINAIYGFLGENIKFSEKTNGFGDTERIIRNYEEKVDIEKYIDLDNKINILDKIDSIDIHVIRYLPQSIGILISELFEIPIIFR